MGEGRDVIVISFPKYDENVQLAWIIEQVKAPFENIEDIKVHLASRDAAETIISFLNPLDDEPALVKHAKEELSRVGNDDEFNNSIIRAIRGFCSYGHSGGSASVAIPMIYDLLQGKNLTPLTDNPDEWMHISDDRTNGQPVWQSRRRSDAFSLDGGKRYYLLSEGASLNNPEPLHKSLEVS